MSKINRIIKLVLNDIAEFFPYFLVFYIVSVLLSMFGDSWKLFFNWPAFHIATIILGVLSIFSNSTRTIIYEVSNRAKFPAKTVFSRILQPSIKTKNKLKYIIYWLIFQAYRISLTIFYTVRWLLMFLISILSIVIRLLIDISVKKIRKLNRYDYEKIILLFVILIFALYKNIDAFSFTVLAYALISFLFFVDSRISATIALVFLFFCPIFLIIKKDALAELFAVYSYYFLVIVAIAQIKECCLRDKLNRLEKKL